MKKFIILVGTINSICNIMLKRVIEKNPQYKVLCFVDSYNKGEIVEGIPVISLDEIKDFLKSSNVTGNIEVYFLFPFNTEGRKKVFETIKKALKDKFHFKTYEKVIQEHKKILCSILREDLVWLEEIDINEIKENLRFIRDGIPKELLKLMTQCFN
jgi:hypothetical protein